MVRSGRRDHPHAAQRSRQAHARLHRSRCRPISRARRWNGWSKSASNTWCSTCPRSTAPTTRATWSATACSSDCRRAARARGDAARSRATITELAFIPDEVHDGPCILALAVPGHRRRRRAQPADCVSSGAMNASPRDLQASSELLPQFSTSRDFALDCDAADILAPYRKQFELPVNASGQPLNYLCGHSLGLAPRAALDYVSEELADWAQLGVGGHHTATRPWIDYAQNFTKGLQHVTGALASEVVAMNSLTVNLHLMMASFYRPVGMRDKVLIEAGAFSSDRHAILGQLVLAQARPRGHADRARAARRRGTAAHRGHRGEDRGAGQRARAGAVARRAVPHRPGVRLRAHRARRACSRRDGRLRPGACHRQPAAGSCTTGTSISRCGARTSI